MTIGRIVLSLGLGVFAIAAMANGLDRISPRATAAARLVPRPFRAQADRSAASTDLALQKNVAALAHASAAVLHDPVDPDSTALLGAARLVAGNADGAASAFRIAARFGWRNVATQLYWYQASLEVGDFGVAADRADAILRAHPAYAQRDALLKPLETDPVARKALLRHLSKSPTWLQGYLTIDPDGDRALVDRRVLVISQLGAEGTALGCSRVTSFTYNLLNMNRRADAEKVWNGHCPERPIASLIADSDFSMVDASQPFPFGWQLKRSGDVSIRRNDSAQHGLVASNSAATTELLLYQPVAFSPGTYRLRVSADEVSARGQRILLSFACNGPLPFPRFYAGNPTAEGVTIRVGDCPRQQIGLWLSAGNAPVTLNSVSLERLD